MADEVTTGMLLEHMQLMKSELLERLGVFENSVMHLDNKVTSLDHKFTNLDHKVTSLEHTMTQGFREAKEHRIALQEDLEATMRVQQRHSKKLARIS